MSNCNCHNEIMRDGSGRLDRYLKALDPAYAPVDNRSMEELLVFAKRYAAQIRFYDIPESQVNGTADTSKISWKEFFRRDMAVIAASIALIDLEQVKKDYEETRNRVESTVSTDAFSDLFDPVMGMITRIDKWYSLAIWDNPLHDDLKLAIQSDLKQQFKLMLSYAKGFLVVDAQHSIQFDLSGIENPDIWEINQTVDTVTWIYQGNDVADKIRAGALYVDDIFNAFFGFISNLVEQSDRYMQFAIQQYPAHQPHMALFISFLKLFSMAQQQMNGLTERMLNFYYRDVLRLVEKPAIPDRAHIVFELAKDVVAHHLPQGTELTAGPDASGIEQLYTTEVDLVINEAKVKELKTIFIEKTAGATAESSPIRNIYARPVANSQDGFGEKFISPYPKWPTFGKGSAPLSFSTNLCDRLSQAIESADQKDDAQLGFAIASPQLVLQNGNRLISLRFPDFKKIWTDDLKPNLEIKLSGEEGWITIKKSLVSFGKEIAPVKDGIFINDLESGYDFNSAENTLYIYLSIGEKGISSFDPEVHEGRNYATAFPVLELMIGNELNIPANIFQGVTFADLSISIQVGSMNKRETAAQTPFTGVVSGHVYDHTGAPIVGATVTVTGTTTATTTGADGSYTLTANANDELHVSAAGFVSQDIDINGKSSIDITLPPDQGGFPEYLIVKSFFDGLKILILENDDGPLPINKPFDPFTSLPMPGNSLYIGSNEIFNKPVNELTVNLKHLSEETDRLLDFNFPRLSSRINFKVYKVSALENRQWNALCTPGRTDFSEWELTYDILFADIEGKGTAIDLKRLPLVNNTTLNEKTEKGFIKIELGDLLKDFPEKPPMDIPMRQAMAAFFKMKEISLSYLSELTSLDPAIDQVFHVYPFGETEIYAGSGNQVFKELDQKKHALLVDARQKLLPQFTYLHPDSKYKDSSSAKSPNDYVRSNIHDRIQERAGRTDTVEPIFRMMIAASGVLEKSSGYPNQYAHSIQEEGMLFIGIEKLKPLQTLSLLFQFAEGSAVDEENTPPPIHWSYLSNNEWRPMKAEQIISDGTEGFQTTGIVKIDVPADATNSNTIITNGLHWFCASVTEYADRVPQLVDVVAQAVTVQFDNKGNDESHFDKALPAGSISRLFTEAAEVSKINQPFASFDGKHKEAGKEYYARVSERLRHKGRAVNSWDYERLILDRFNSIYKVKSIPHTDPDCLCRRTTPVNPITAKVITIGFETDSAQLTTESSKLDPLATIMKADASLVLRITAFFQEPGHQEWDLIKARFKAVRDYLSGKTISESRIRYMGEFSARDITVVYNTLALTFAGSCCGPQIAPGHVLIVPIANLKNRNAINPLQPKTSRRILLEIERYLKSRISPFVHVHAKNPVYEQVIVFFRVKFHTGIEKGFYLKKLNDEIVRYLTPWAFDESAVVTFNQKIYASSIINFIEERPYVDFITDFMMGVCKDDCCTDIENAIVTRVITGNSILRDRPEPALRSSSASRAGIYAGVVTDKRTGRPLPGVAIVEKGSTNSTLSNNEGEFRIRTQSANAILLFRLSGYNEMAHITTDDQTTLSITMDLETNTPPPGVDPPEPDDTDSTGNNTSAVATWDQLINSMATNCGCAGIELILPDPDFTGEIVATPSTSRSILVSAARHIILVYEPPPSVTPCEKRAAVKAESEIKNIQPYRSAEIQKPGQVNKSETERVSAPKKSEMKKPGTKPVSRSSGDNSGKRAKRDRKR